MSLAFIRLAVIVILTARVSSGRRFSIRSHAFRRLLSTSSKGTARWNQGTDDIIDKGSSAQIFKNILGESNQENYGIKNEAVQNPASSIHNAPFLPIAVPHAAVTETSAFQESSNPRASIPSSSRPTMWPPWPFNLLRRKPQQGGMQSPDVAVTEKSSSSGAYLFWSFTKESARIGLLNLREIGSQLWYHLPPGAPPLILWASLPRTTVMYAPESGVEFTKTIVPLLSNPFARTVALTGLGLAIMSWAHYEVHHRRRLTALPLSDSFRDIRRAVLPPFLPEEEMVGYLENIPEDVDDDDDEEDSRVKEMLLKTTSENATSSRLHKFYRMSRRTRGPGNLQRTLREWRRIKGARKQERRNARRLSILNQLLALQTLKQKANTRRKQQHRNQPHENGLVAGGNTDDALGYALVTGASRGIGRAIAVELARWEIPLILVARDVTRLTSLAYDLEACYGVKCCVLEADLTKPGVAEDIHRATEKAGLKVDILVNNAGISSQGTSVDIPLEQMNNMVGLNVMAVSTLTHLYGKDMKTRRRGRILIVSSICGAVEGIPTVAVYSATKAFEKTLGISLAKEMERYGVGVTTLLPGAVKDTDFKSRSNSDKALCWRIPSYPKSPPQVAEMGVRALLRGDQEITPGIWNRVFLKVMKPALPQRLHNFIAEVMWNPIPRLRKRQEAAESTVSITYEIPKADKMNAIAPNRSYNLPNPPTLLQLEVKEPEQNFSLDSRADEENTRIDMSPERELDHFQQTKNSSSPASFSGSSAQPHESLMPSNIDFAPLNSPSLPPAQPPPSASHQLESQMAPSSSNDFFSSPSTGFSSIESQSPKSPSRSPQTSHPRSEARGGNSDSTAQQPSQQGENSDSGVRQRRQILQNMDRMALSINGDW